VGQVIRNSSMGSLVDDQRTSNRRVTKKKKKKKSIPAAVHESTDKSSTKQKVSVVTSD